MGKFEIGVIGLPNEPERLVKFECAARSLPGLFYRLRLAPVTGSELTIRKPSKPGGTRMIIKRTPRTLSLKEVAHAIVYYTPLVEQPDPRRYLKPKV